MFRVLDGPSPVRSGSRRGRRAVAARAAFGALVVGLLAAGSAAPALAQAPVLDDEPVWQAPAGQTTSALAAADVDLDGDLDLVRGTESGVVQLFKNRDGGLESAPKWTATVPGAVAGLALGDLNGDGRADLTVAVQGDTTRVYWSSTASVVFPETPSRRIPFVDAASLILADVDADGDADVVCAGRSGALSAHRNDGGNFSALPVWSAAGPAAHLAAGDVDGDGRLDLCASDAVSGMRLYHGEGDAFGAAPVWSQAGPGRTGVALGDLDGDGDLDLAVGGTAPAATCLFENQSGTLTAAPVFTWSAEDSTATVALGDADADGDLDLACGNTSPSRVYRNGGALTQWSKAWEERPGAPAVPAQVRWLDVDGDLHRDLLVARDGAALYHNHSAPFGALAVATPIAGSPLAVTDLNGDDRPDLVVAAAGGPAALHWNTGTRFDANAAWTSAPGTAIVACAAGDVNQDGALDLVVGGSVIALYLHDGTALAAAPAWTQALDGVTAVAVRDVDLDGRADIVFGRTRIPSLVCFLNRGGTFRELPDWEGGSAPVSSIALADIDRDGDLDLAAGMMGDGAVLFEFSGGAFGPSPRATFMAGANTVRVFLDDLDGDGDPDLVLANAGQSASFTNFDGFFAESPAQTTPVPRAHVDGVVDDLDADGDLDLVLLASDGDVSEFYAGARGQFDTPTALPGTNAERLYAADVDGDGDVDLVTGGGTAFVTVVAGNARPGAAGGPDGDANALPDQEPWLRSLRMAPGGRNLQHFTVEAFDAENDSVWIIAESQVRGSRAWDVMDAGAGHGLLGPFAVSAAGVPLEFDWDVSRLPTTHDPFQVRLRTVALRSRTGEPQAVSAYAFAAGTLRVERPIIAAEPLFMRFDRVTVGDTTSAVLTVRNDGTEPLVISQFEFEGTHAMRTNPPAPLVIEPGAHSQVFLMYEPMVPEPGVPTQPRFCFVHSNDPAHQRTAIELSLEAGPLSGRAQALLPDSVATLGEPIVVQATPDPFVHIERATLYAGPSSGQHNAFPMKKRPGDFIGTIPGALVRESGLQFYVEFENSGVLARDPAGAPDSVITVPIGPPSRLVVTPQPTSRFDFLVGRDINVEVTLEVGAEFTGGTLYYRRGGEVNFATEPVLTDYLHGITRATIPAGAVGPRGLEFYAQVHTLTDSLVYPKSGARAPDSIRTLAPSFSEPDTHAGGRYRMLSVPLDFGIDAARTLDALLADQPEFGPYDPLRWRAFRYLGTAGNVERQPGDPRFTVVPGRAFWLVSRAAHRVDTAPIEGLSVSTAVPFPIVLEPGWNQIGNPFAFPVRWSRVRHSAAVEDPVAFDPESGASGEYRTEPATVLVPFDGYFVFNRSADAETLFVPPLDADLEPVRSVPAVASPAAAWSIEVAAMSRTARDGGNRALVCADARDGFDALDRREPPVPPAPWVSAAFRAAGAGGSAAAPALLRTDARTPGAPGQEWPLQVSSSAAAEILDVDVHLNGDLPPGFALWMLDEDTGSVTALDAAGAGNGWVRAARLRSHGPERVCRLRLLAGTPDWLAQARAALVALPARVTLAQNAPNPFNATTRVRFGLPEASAAALEIFDARGRRVTVLVDETLPAGWHDRLWDGRDTQGRPVATGIYFCRLRAGSAVQTRRLVLVE